MEVEILDEETVEVYTTGRSSKRQLPEGVARKLILRLHSLKCAVSKSDILNCAAANFDGQSLKLTNEYRVRAVNHKHHWDIKEIFKK